MVYLVAITLNLLPLAGLSLRSARGRAVAPAWWWMGAGFAVSWLADVGGYLVGTRAVSTIYPVGQALCFLVALVPRPLPAMLVVVGAGVLAVFLRVRWHLDYDVLLHTVACGSIVAAALQAKAPVLPALAIGFGLWLLAWWAFVVYRSPNAYSAYQLCRCAGVGLFLCAALR